MKQLVQTYRVQCIWGETYHTSTLQHILTTLGSIDWWNMNPRSHCWDKIYGRQKREAKKNWGWPLAFTWSATCDHATDFCTKRLGRQVNVVIFRKHTTGWPSSHMAYFWSQNSCDLRPEGCHAPWITSPSRPSTWQASQIAPDKALEA